MTDLEKAIAEVIFEIEKLEDSKAKKVMMKYLDNMVNGKAKKLDYKAGLKMLKKNKLI